MPTSVRRWVQLVLLGGVLVVSASSLVAQAPRAARPRVYIIATGGTISNLGDDKRRTGTELVDGIPRIREIADVTVEQFSNVASGAVTQEMWRSLTLRIRAMQQGDSAPAGFVVTHGTDTMEETADRKSVV